MRARVKDILGGKFEAKSTVIKGWVRSVRKSKSVAFVILNDGSSFDNLQIVIDEKLADYEELTKMTMGYCIEAHGNVVKSGGAGQSFEMQATAVKILGTVPEDYPLQKKATSLEFLREVAHLRPRTNTFNAVFRLRHILAMATHQFFSERGFYYINTPLITGSDAEGAGELFRVSTLHAENPPKNKDGKVDFSKDYFGRETFLAVTGQLEAEAYALALGSVYTFGPTFRSENSNTARHLSEFWMIEPEVAFADLDEIAKLGADFIQALIAAALKNARPELDFFQKHYKSDLISVLEHVANTDFKRITYTEAVEILQKTSKKFDFPVSWGMDLQTEHERYICEEHFKASVIVTDYPKEIKAFYMKLNADGKTVKAMDILVPGVGEIIGGSQREDSYELLLERMQAKKLNPAEYQWYLDLRRFGGAPHAGFGLGFERAIMYITGMSNIRDVIAFPRTPKNCEF